MLTYLLAKLYFDVWIGLAVQVGGSEPLQALQCIGRLWRLVGPGRVDPWLARVGGLCADDLQLHDAIWGSAGLVAALRRRLDEIIHLGMLRQRRRR